MKKSATPVLLEGTTPGVVRIGVFDSGLGGLTILKHLETQLSQAEYIYLADQKNCPYGERSSKEILKLTQKAVKRLVDFNCSLIVVACNTATAVAIDFLRKQYPDVKFVGVEPVVKPVSKKTQTGHALVLSTVSTAKSPRTQKLLKKYAKNKTIYSLGCKGVVELIETGLTEGEKLKAQLVKCLKPVAKDKKIDVLGLSCTHFPLVNPEVWQLFNQRVELISPEIPVVRQVKRLVSKLGPKTKKPIKKTRFLTTGKVSKVKEVVKRLFKLKDLEFEAIIL